MSTEVSGILKLFADYYGNAPESVTELPPSGSYRRYFRLRIKSESFIGVYNSDIKENRAFLEFTQKFLDLGLNVPEILAQDLENNVYLLQDLGDTTLLSFISENTTANELSTESIEMYKKVIEQLPLFQVKAGKVIDYSVCYPRHAFDKQSMMWDLNYFKYYFLKLAKVSFDEQNLEDDFQKFSDYLLQADSTHFLYRDFQSRNVMVYNNEPYFIDYQGGRRGALQYDIASLLFEAKTSLTPEIRNVLLEHYLISLSKYHGFNRQQFVEYYYGYVYIRLMQAMGAYGFRGLYEKKELFLQSIPKALEHLKWLRLNMKLEVPLPELEKVWDMLIESEYIRNLASSVKSLTVTINSFSYKRGIPVDETKNGGGFVFDCRTLNNPGRYDEYKQITGLDKPVIEFLEKDNSVNEFLTDVSSIVCKSIDKYLERGFSNLMISFGCTGGQHRSVYSAEKLSTILKNKYTKLNVITRHREIEMKR